MMAKEIMYQAAKDPKLLRMKPKVRRKQVAKKSFLFKKLIRMIKKMKNCVCHRKSIFKKIKKREMKTLNFYVNR